MAVGSAARATLHVLHCVSAAPYLLHRTACVLGSGVGVSWLHCSPTVPPVLPAAVAGCRCHGSFASARGKRLLLRLGSLAAWQLQAAGATRGGCISSPLGLLAAH